MIDLEGDIIEEQNAIDEETDDENEPLLEDKKIEIIMTGVEEIDMFHCLSCAP